MKSSSEIDTVSKRATKASGFSWGIAEEVGKNIKTLELFGHWWYRKFKCLSAH